MLQVSTLKFLSDLKKNNDKSWFDKHRTQYDAAREDFLQLVGDIIRNIAVFDAPIGHLAAKDCVFRINRDVRFSKDKRPYKNNMAGYFNKAGKKGNGAGYYLHVEPGNSFAAGGIWMPEPGVLAGIRQEIDYNFDDWKKIVEGRSFKKVFPAGITGDALTRPPKGYELSNPAIAYLKMKSFVVTAPITDAELRNKDFPKKLSSVFKTLKPMIDFLNMVVE
jgi:uncharacterized protein (TIGR02453 family)